MTAFLAGAASPARAADKVDFEHQIKPILELDCVRCHGAEKPKGGLRLDTKSGALQGGDNGTALVPGKPDQSPLYTSTIVPVDDDKHMPPKGDPLKKDQTDLLRVWIEQGAVWPEGLPPLIARKQEAAPGADEGQVVAEIHKLILSRPGPTTEAQMKLYTNTIPGTTVQFAMVPIRGGEVLMGSPENEPGRKPDESPQHKVKISPFWMGQCEVTWNEFELFMFPEEEQKLRLGATSDAYVDKVSDAVTRPTKPYVEMSFGMGKDGYPAISMTQHAANKYCEWLSGKTGQFYRLPTEAEWEYACRAGTTTAYSFGDNTANLGDYAWYEKNSDFKYHKVGTKKANPWNLYDMHGNATEWCLDQYEPNYSSVATGEVSDPWIKPTKPYPHVVRGGSWDDEADKLRSATRRGSDKMWKQQDPQLPKSVWYHTDAQFLGFRIVRPLKVPAAEEMRIYWNNGVERD
jgi:formylglycine-generating enzyme required for sulfatase activity